MVGKPLAKEEDSGSGGSSSEGEHEMVSARGDPNSESGNSNLGSGNLNPSEKEDRLGEEPTRMEVSMVFMIPVEFRASMENVAELGVERWRWVLNVSWSRSQKTQART
jgi:hypothetical protein